MLVAGYMFMCVVTILFFPHTAVGTTPRAEHMKGVACECLQCHPMHIIFIYHSSKAIVDEGWFSAGVNSKKTKSLCKTLHYDRPFVHLVLVGKVQKQPCALAIQDGFG